jgi:hypothetical protein
MSKSLLLWGLIGLVLLLVTNVNADLGSFNQYSCVGIKTILNTDNVTLSSVMYPNGSSLYLDRLMSKNGLTFNYSFCDTNQIGQYIYDYHDSNNGVYENTFSIHGYTNRGILGIDLTSGLGIALFFVMLALGFILLFFEETHFYGSTIVLICGFITLFSGLSLIFSIILIVIGVLSIIYKT